MIMGLTPVDVGKRDASATYRLLTCVRFERSALMAELLPKQELHVAQQHRSLQQYLMAETVKQDNHHRSAVTPSQSFKLGNVHVL